MPKLHQIIAVEKGTKNEANTKITAAYHAVQKPELFKGISRTYRVLDEEKGERFPDEHKKVVQHADQLLALTGDIMTGYWDLTLTKDTGNQHAKADVKLPDGTVILKDAPVTFLLFLDKQLGDLASMVKKLPVLDPGETWHRDAATAAWATDPAETHKMKKLPRAFVKAEATKEHPAQVDVVGEDLIVGYWKVIQYSGAMPQARIDMLLKRISDLQAAVKFAREEANSIDVSTHHVGKAVFDFLLA